MSAVPVDGPKHQSSDICQQNLALQSESTQCAWYLIRVEALLPTELIMGSLAAKSTHILYFLFLLCPTINPLLGKKMDDISMYH